MHRKIIKVKIMNTNQTKNNPMSRVMALRDFRLLISGAGVSLLGDQFALIATPWLVLKLTNDPLALGTVLALEGIPRAVFMLFGGAITDRLSPRLVMLAANITRTLLTAVMALLVLSGLAQLWAIYVFGLLMGTVAGFTIPAETSIVPMLVEEQDLRAGNSVMMGIAQLAGFVGPTIAGILIGRFAGTLMGVGVAFAVDAFSFVVSAVTLQLIRATNHFAQAPRDSEVAGASRDSEAASGASEAAPDPSRASKENVLASIKTGIQYLWKDKPLRLIFLVLAAINFLLMGPLMVGIPVLANQRLPEGATAFGLLFSAYAGGNLAGYLLAGSLRRLDGQAMRWMVLLLIAAFGVVIGALGYITSTWIDFSLLLLLGLGNGNFAIILVTWMQTRVPKEMLGRIMSLVMLTSTGLAPISQAISGVISKWNLTLLFALPGMLVLLVTFGTAFSPDFTGFIVSLAKTRAEG